MNVRLCFLLVLGFESIFSAEKGSPCVTPNKENATCKPLAVCDEIYSAVGTGYSEAIKFAKESLCGFDGTDPLVCCGSLGVPSATVVSDDDGEELLADFDLGTSLLPESSICGLVEGRYKISGAKFSNLTEFPWSAALEYTSTETNETEIKCGGTLINNRFVLTAAHCLLYPKHNLTAVLLGEWKLSTNPDCLEIADKGECAPPVKKYKIGKQIPHYFYSNGSKSNDVGLIKLEKDVVYDGFARPICLLPLNLLPSPPGTMVTIAGWSARENGTPVDVKRKLEVPLVGDCKNKLNPTNITLSANQQCLSREQGKDSCWGDSGGAVMKLYKDVVFKEAQWYLEGVISWDMGCTNSQYPIVFHRISRYINWIKYTVTVDAIESNNITKVDD